RRHTRFSRDWSSDVCSSDLVDVDPLTPPAHGVVIAVEATGVCRSDWHAWSGHDDSVTAPHVPGHELVGTIARAGEDVTGFAPGEIGRASCRERGRRAAGAVA